MKKIYLLLFGILLTVSLYSQATGVALSPRLHGKYNLNENMSIQSVADSLGIPLDEFKTHFHLSLRDSSIDVFSLRRHNISVDDVYQFYNMRKYGFNDFTQISEIITHLQIPFMKLAEYMGIGARDAAIRTRTLRDLQKETLDMIDYQKRFQEDMLQVSSTLTVLGMLAALIALSVTALVISQLVHLKNKEPMPKPIITAAIPVVKSEPEVKENINSDSVVAAIIAIHRLNADVEKENRAIINWRRASISMWQASGKVQLSAQTYNVLKNRR